MKNTGTDCIPLIEVSKKAMLMPVFDSTGTKNYIDLTDTLDQAYFTDLINETDTSKRLYPLPEMKNIADTRGEAVTEEFDDGTKTFIRDGARSFEGLLLGKYAAPALKGKIESARCGEMGVFLVDRVGSLIGIVSDDKTKLYPFRMDSESISATLIQPTGNTKVKINVKFNFHPDVDDGCIGMVTKSEMADADLLSVKGLVDVYPTFSAITTGGFTMKLVTDYGTPINPTTVKNQVAANFTAYNVTQSSSIAIVGTGAAFVEDPLNPGTYAVEYATADDTTSLDVVRISMAAPGYEMAPKTFPTP